MRNQIEHRIARHAEDEYPFSLPELGYGYGSLEPAIDRRTMQIHHRKHHRGYVEGLNEAIERLRDARDAENYDQIQHWQRKLSFNWAGHRNHCLFWKTIGPFPSSPTETARLLITEHFGSVEKFRRHFIEAGLSVEGGGWAMLCTNPSGKHLEIESVRNHQNSFPPGLVPLLVVDVWEHAYYLKYQNDRERYLRNFWRVIDWEAFEGRLADCTGFA